MNGPQKRSYDFRKNPSMYLSTSAQNDTAARIAKWVRENTTGYSAVATKVGQAGYPGAAVVAIPRDGATTCTAKVAVRHNCIVYTSKLGGRISFPADANDPGRIISSFLSLEGD